MRFTGCRRLRYLAGIVFLACGSHGVAAQQMSVPDNPASARTAAPPIPPAYAPPPAGPPPAPKGPPYDAGMSPNDLIARIKILERRLNELESRRSGQTASKSQGKAGAGKAANVPAASPASTNAVTSGSDDPPVASASATASPSSPAGYASEAEKQRSVQGSFLYRNTAPTLETNKLEVSGDANYTRNVAGTNADRLGQGSLAARYGLGYGFEVAAIVPYYVSSRSNLNLITGAIDERTAQGMGDVQLQVSRQLWKPGEWYPGAALMIGAALPTGEHPYKNVGFTNNGSVADPRSPFSPLLASRGHWAAVSNVQFYKTFDPVILFFGLGIDHAFARDVDGFSVRPGDRFLYNAGFSFALSEHTTLGAQYLGSTDKPLTINGQRTPGALVNDSARARLLVVQRMGDELYLEPSLVLGLTNDVPGYTVGMTLRKRVQ